MNIDVVFDTRAASCELRAVTESFDGAVQPANRKAAAIYKDSVYNAQGLKELETGPYFAASVSSTIGGTNDVGVTKIGAVDALGRVLVVYTTDLKGLAGPQSFGSYGLASRPAAKTTITYSGLNTTTTNDKGQPRTEEKNPLGELLRVTDASGAQVAYQRDAFGNLITTKDALQNKIEVAFDTRGRKTSIVDRDAGLTTYGYDALGQLVWQQNAKQLALGTDVKTRMKYDKLGRMIERTEPEYISTWSYDKNADGVTPCMAGTAPNRGTGRLCESTTSHGVNRKVSVRRYRP